MQGTAMGLTFNAEEGFASIVATNFQRNRQGSH